MRTLAVVIGALALLSAVGATPVVAAAPTPSPTPAQDTQLIAEIRARLGGGLAGALTAQAQLRRAIEQNAAQRRSVWRQVDATDARIAELDAAIAAREIEIRDVRERLDGERAEVAALARAIDEQPTSLVERVVQAGGLGELLHGVADLAAAGRRGDALVAGLDRDRQRLEQAQEQQQAERATQAEMRARQQADLDVLRRLMAEEDRVSVALAGSIARTRSALAGTTTDAALIQRILDMLLADQAVLVGDAEQVAWEQAAVWIEANPQQLATLGTSPPTLLDQPVPGATVSQGFGPTDLAIEPPRGGYPHFHTGIDLAAPEGTPVLAADDGMVAATDSGPTGYGTYLVVAHAGGLQTLYGHLLQPLVRVGDRIARGQAIGLLGSTGTSTGPHCHFEVRAAGSPVDPAPLLRG